MPPLRPATTNTSKQGNDLGPLVEEKHNIQRKNAGWLNYRIPPIEAPMFPLYNLQSEVLQLEEILYLSY